ncbi:12736_t:CDS:2 [Dentiscutata erythropus]|uniref:12736_t:CDS:1 n=1 Tax=Dentiscutata erythropus TaxID=1348616 RepID=A0A9N9CBL1_9GLOM|nr:12736_t:CDS:2 [Dentiscutata erythropus]
MRINTKLKQVFGIQTPLSMGPSANRGISIKYPNYLEGRVMGSNRSSLFLSMVQSINRINNAQLRNNNAQSQRPHNIGGPQDAGNLLHRIPNAALRPQNSTNPSIDTFDADQQHIDLFRGISFTEVQVVENSENPPPLIDQFFSGYSFP